MEKALGEERILEFRITKSDSEVTSTSSKPNANPDNPTQKAPQVENSLKPRTLPTTYYLPPFHLW